MTILSLAKWNTCYITFEAKNRKREHAWFNVRFYVPRMLLTIHLRNIVEVILHDL